MSLTNVIIGVLASAILALGGYQLYSVMTSSAQASSAKNSIDSLITQVADYSSSSTKVGTLRGISLASMGITPSSVAIADDADYQTGEIIKTDSDNAITVTGDTFTSIKMLTDSDADGFITDGDNTADLAAGTDVVALPTNSNLFYIVTEGSALTGATNNDASIYIGYGAGGADASTMLSKLERKFHSGDYLVVINGADAGDGAFVLNYRLAK